MKHVVFLIAFLTQLPVFSQEHTFVVKNLENQLTGIWNITNYYDERQFHDIFEFKADSTFYQLKYLNEANPQTLSPDEYGTWSIKNDTITIVGIGEISNGTKVVYDQPFIFTFKVIQEKEEYCLVPVKNNDKTPNITLKLTRRKQ